MVLSEKTLYSLGRRCVYIFNRRKAKKEIPVKLAILNWQSKHLAQALAQAFEGSANLALLAERILRGSWWADSAT